MGNVCDVITRQQRQTTPNCEIATSTWPGSTWGARQRQGGRDGQDGGGLAQDGGGLAHEDGYGTATGAGILGSRSPGSQRLCDQRRRGQGPRGEHPRQRDMAKTGAGSPRMGAGSPRMGAGSPRMGAGSPMTTAWLVKTGRIWLVIFCKLIVYKNKKRYRNNNIEKGEILCRTNMTIISRKEILCKTYVDIDGVDQVEAAQGGDHGDLIEDGAQLEVGDWGHARLDGWWTTARSTSISAWYELQWRYIRDKKNEHSRALLHIIIYYNVRRAEVGGDGPGGDIDVEKGRSSSRT